MLATPHRLIVDLVLESTTEGKVHYLKPTVADYGTVEELTANCFGSGATDELGKSFPDLEFPKTAPLNGDDSFCAPGP